MARRAVTLLAIGLAATGFARSKPDDPRALIRAAVDFMGGETAVRQVNRLRYMATTVTFFVGQGDRPDSPLGPNLSVGETEYIDRAARSQVIRRPITGQRFSSVLFYVGDSGAAFIDTVGSRHIAANPFAVDLVRRNAESGLPHWLLLDALDAPASSLRTAGTKLFRGRRVAGVNITLPRDTARLWFNVDDHSLASIERMSDDPALGTRTTEIEFANWARTGEVRLPWTRWVSVNGTLNSARSMSRVELAPAVDSMLSVAKFPLAPYALTIVGVTEVVPGVYRLEGNNGFSPMAIQQGDSIVLFEAPVNAPFVRAMLDTLRARFPSTPPRTFVVTHHHTDHLGGVKTAFDAGLRAIALSDLVPIVRSAGLRPGERSTRPRSIVGVGDSLTVGTGPTRMVLYRVPTSHATAFMLGYLPEQRLMLEVDIIGPPDSQRDLYNFATARGLKIDKISRFHGPVTMWDAYVATLPK